MYSKMLIAKHQGQTILIYHVILLCNYLYHVCAKRLQFILRLGGNETDFTVLYSRTSFYKYVPCNRVLQSLSCLVHSSEP